MRGEVSKHYLMNVYIHDVQGIVFFQQVSSVYIMGRHSKLQLQVLSLYRNLLRVARCKPGATEYVQYEFRKNASISKTEVMRIEHLLRRGERQLEGLKKPSTSGIGLFHYNSIKPETK